MEHKTILSNSVPRHFTYCILGFCFPILLWPLALILSPTFIESPTLSDTTSIFFTSFLIGYPFILFVLARLLFRLAKNYLRLAQIILAISAVLFYGVLVQIVQYLAG